MIRRAIRQARKVEQAYQDALRDLGCVVCRWRGVPQCGATEIHHRNLDDKHGQKQLGQDAVVPMCQYHHSGLPLWGWSGDEMREEFGPSFALHATDFRNWTADDALPQYPGRGTERWQHYADDLLRESGFGELVDVVRGQREAA